jgi:membrane protein DedA with SNARE-associated domain
MTDFLLTQIINNGLPIIGLVLFIGAAGAPLPSTLTVIAVGAFCNQGIFSWPAAALVGWVGAVMGDSVSYAMGYYARERILRRFSGTPTWTRGELSFQRWGGMSIFLTRFLVTAIAVPVNLIAGTGDYPYGRFLLYDLTGEAIWILGFGYLGYLFGSDWQVVSDFMTNFGGLMLGLVILIIGIVLAVRWLRISPESVNRSGGLFSNRDKREEL